MVAVRPDDVDGTPRGTLSRGVQVYREGICHLSVCAPNDLTAGEVLAIVNREWPTGLPISWALDGSPTFSGGQPNPCPCERDRGRTHRLLVC